MGPLGFDILWNHIVVPYVSKHWGDVKAWMCTCKRMYDAVQKSTLLPPKFSICKTDEELALVTRTRFTSNYRCTWENVVKKAIAKQVFALYGVDFGREFSTERFPSAIDGGCIYYSEPYCYIRSDCYHWQDNNFYALGRLLEKVFPMLFYLQVINTAPGTPLWMFSKESIDIHRGCVMILHIYLPHDMMKYERPPNKRRCFDVFFYDESKQLKNWEEREAYYEAEQKSFHKNIELNFEK